METLHPEGGESPFVVKEDASMAAIISLYDEDVEYASCPVDGCGEAILFTELDSHIEMHDAEEEDTGQETEPTSKRLKVNEGARGAFLAKSPRRTLW